MKKYLFFASAIVLLISAFVALHSFNSVEAQTAGNGTLTVNGSFGTYTMSSYNGGPYKESRPLTQDEINQISLSLSKYGPLWNTPIISGVKIGQSVTVPSGAEIVVEISSAPAGWASVHLDSCGPVVSGGSSSCDIGFYDQIHWLGTNATTSATNYNRYPVTSQAEQGPAAILPQANPGMASASYQKNLIDLTGGNKNSSSTDNIQSTQVFNYGGKKYLLVLEENYIKSSSQFFSSPKMSLSSPKMSHILVYDLANPFSPVLLKDNSLPTVVNNYIASLDGYEYLFVNSVSATYSLKFNPSGTLNVSQVSLPKDASVSYLFGEKNKVYSVVYHSQDYTKTYPGDPVAAGHGYTNAKANDGQDFKRPNWTNPLVFYDITKGPDFSDSNIVGGYRHPAYDGTVGISVEALEGFISSVSQGDVLSYNNSPAYSEADSTYLVTVWQRSVHYTHGASYDVTILDVSDISNPKVVSNESIANTFSTTKDNTGVEGSCLDNESFNSLFFDFPNGKAVVDYSHFPAYLTFDPYGCYYQPARPDGGNLLRFARSRQGIIGFDVSDGNGALNFNEIPNSRQVLSECLGDGGQGRPCDFGTNTINFNTPLAFNNGLLVGSQGKIALVSDSNGFSYMDASAEFKKFLSDVATTTPYSSLNPLNPNGSFQNASLYQIDSKTFALYIGDQYHLQVMKISLASSVGAPASGSSYVNPSSTISTTTLQTLQQSLFSFQNLLNIFKRALGK